MKRLSASLLALLLAGCATPYIDRSITAVSQDSRVQYLIIHYTAGDFEGSLKTLSQGAVSAHYLVKDKPAVIYGLVDENRRAYQAGVSSWHGDTALNSGSIGIEIVNRGFTDDKATGVRTYYDFPPEQIDAVLALSKKIIAEHHIKPDHVIGHSDIAPQRKFDPGPRFPWKRFADAGLIVWPDAALVAERKPMYEQSLPDATWFQKQLAKHGYLTPQTGLWDHATRNVLIAFQTKYRPALFDGTPDAESAAMLDAMTSPKTPSWPPAPTLPPVPAPVAAPAAAMPAPAPAAK